MNNDELKTIKVLFNTTSKKNIRKFEEVTPEKNKIEGYIYLGRNKKLGSLVLTKVNGEQLKEPVYIQGMPKLFKWSQVYGSKTHIPFTEIYVYEKLDGTNITFYPLFSADGEFLELVPKTRQRAVASEQFLDLLSTLDVSWVYHGCLNRDSLRIFCCELYGKRNKHLIDYDIDIGLCFLCAFEYAEIYSPSYIFDSEHSPSLLAKITESATDVSWFLLTYGLKVSSNLRKLYKSFEETFYNINKRGKTIKTEGAVWHIWNEFHSLEMVKCKAKDVKKLHEEIFFGVPRQEVISAILKLVENEIPLTVDNVIKELKEDFEYKVLKDKKTQNRIKSCIYRYTKQQKAGEEIRRIVEDINANCPNDSLSDKMRWFAMRYPDKRHLASKVYNMLVKSR